MTANICVYIEGYSTVFPQEEASFPSRFRSIVTNYVNFYVDTSKPELIAYVPGTSSFVGRRVENLFYHYEPDDPEALFDEFATLLELLFEFGLESTTEMEQYQEVLRRPKTLRGSDIPDWIEASKLPAWMWLPEWLWLDPDEDEIRSRDLPRSIEAADLRDPVNRIENQALPDGITPRDIDAIRDALPDCHPNEFPKILQDLPAGVDPGILDASWTRHESNEITELPQQIASAKPELPGLTRLYRRVLNDLFGDTPLVLGAENTGVAASVVSYIHKNNLETTVAIEDDDPLSGIAQTTLVPGNQSFKPLNSETGKRLDEHTEQVRQTWLGTLQGEATNEIDSIVGSDISFPRKYSELIAIKNLLQGEADPSFDLDEAYEINDIYHTIQEDLTDNDLRKFTDEIGEYVEDKINTISNEILEDKVSVLGNKLNSLEKQADSKQTYKNYVQAEEIIQAEYTTELNLEEYDKPLEEVGERWSEILRKPELDERIRSEIRSRIVDKLKQRQENAKESFLKTEISKLNTQLKQIDSRLNDFDEKVENLRLLIDATENPDKLDNLSSALPRRTSDRIRSTYENIHTSDFDESVSTELAGRIESEVTETLSYTYKGFAKKSLDSVTNQNSYPLDEIVELQEWLDSDRQTTGPSLTEPKLIQFVNVIESARNDKNLSNDRVRDIEADMLNVIENALKKRFNDYRSQLGGIFSEFNNKYHAQYQHKRELLDELEQIIEAPSQVKKNDFEASTVRKFYDLWSKIQQDKGLTPDQRGKLENIARNRIDEQKRSAGKKLSGDSTGTQDSLSTIETTFIERNAVPIAAVLALIIGIIAGAVLIIISGLFVDIPIVGDQDNPQNGLNGDGEEFMAELTQPSSDTAVTQENFTVAGNTSASEVMLSVYNRSGSELQSRTVQVENGTFRWTPELEELGYRIVEVRLGGEADPVTVDRRVVEVVSSTAG